MNEAREVGGAAPCKAVRSRSLLRRRSRGAGVKATGESWVVPLKAPLQPSPFPAESTANTDWVLPASWDR